MTATSDIRRAVAIGGGTGLPTVLTCLLALGFETSAVVTMADDGGSTGVLRKQFGMLPPGDARNCLVAMAEEPDGLLARVFQYRFSEGEGLAGHAIGNLILAALADIEGSFPAALEAASALLGTHGTVLPSTLEDVVLHATNAAGDRVRGQARIATSEGPVAQVCMEPESPAAYEPALDAILEADVVVIGPGSLFTSVIPNFLVAGMSDALRDSSAKRVYVCNVANQRGETQGMDAAQHVDALMDHGLAGMIDVAVVHVPRDSSHTAPGVCDDGIGSAEAVTASIEAVERIRSHGIDVVGRALVDQSSPCRHDPDLLCAVLSEVL